MAKYRVSVVVEANSAAEAASHLIFDSDAEFIQEWESLEVEKW